MLDLQAMGTHWGFIIIIDFNGNEIRRFSAHSAAVNDVSVDEACEYVASASDDGWLACVGDVDGVGRFGERV